MVTTQQVKHSTIYLQIIKDMRVSKKDRRKLRRSLASSMNSRCDYKPQFRYLTLSFLWERTPQGYDFWDKLSLKLYMNYRGF